MDDIFLVLQSITAGNPDIFDGTDSKLMSEQLKTAGIDNRSIYILESAIKQFDLYHRLLYADRGKRNDVLDFVTRKLEDEISIQQRTIHSVIANVLSLIEWQEYSKSNDPNGLSDAFLRQLADQGNEHATLQYGLRCFELKLTDIEKEEQYREAMHYLLPLAQSGNPEAQFCCGKMMFFGFGTPVDYDGGISFLTQAAEAGDGQALNQLGRMYEFGNDNAGIVKDLKRAKEYYESASEAGLSVAFNNLGWLHMNYTEVLDHPLAIQYYEKAVELGNDTAAENLADCYYKGHGSTVDIKKAIHYYSIAAKSGRVRSQRTLGYIYGWHKEYQDFKLSKIWSEKAAAQGDIIATNNLAVIYEEGRGVPIDLSAAEKYYLQAAEKGYAPSQRAVGILYASSSQYEKAEYWYKKAATQKDVTAMNNLGVLYGEGHLGKPDYALAHSYCKLAAEAGSETAKTNTDIYYNAFIREMQTIARSNNVVHCPKCKGTDISTQAKGFSFGKAVVGTALFGQIGALGGTIGSNQSKLVCRRCGYVWTPNSVASSITELMN